MGKEKPREVKIFDAVIGNPPYQVPVGNDNGFNPIYHHFIDSGKILSSHGTLIHPGRFLFRAGKTPKDWNEKILNDEHLRIIRYFPSSNEIFPETDIKGGVAVTHWNRKKIFGTIGTFTAFDELNKILHKVTNDSSFESIYKIVVTSYAYHFTKKLLKDHPEVEFLMSKGHAYDLQSNVFARLKKAKIFKDKKPEDNFRYIQIYGLEGRDRVFKHIRSDYVREVRNLYKWKVLLPKANGSGAFEVLSTLVIGVPSTGHTGTFMSIGAFETKREAESCLKYLKSKFARAMLGILKVTQENSPEKWRYVPLQNFSSESDIDWAKSIPEIDKQLYAKYGLDEEEVQFIETHVKEMA